MNIQFKQGVIELCILSLLLKEPLTGYYIEKTLSAQFRIPSGSIYPILRKMTIEGFVEVIIEERNHKLTKFFKITDSGSEKRITLYNQWNSLIGRVNQLIKED